MYATGWYALYTKSRAEKKLKERLDMLQIEAYLPLHWVERRWSDRKKIVEVPLFNSYLFVKTKSETEYFKALKCDGAVRYITLLGKPSIITDKEIDTLHFILSKQNEIIVEATSNKYEKGEWVEIVKGVLKGVMGELVDHHGQHKILIRVGSLEQSIIIDVPIAHISKVLPQNTFL
jgi:transcription antitermination factor NusG